MSDRGGASARAGLAGGLGARFPHPAPQRQDELRPRGLVARLPDAASDLARGEARRDRHGRAGAAVRGTPVAKVTTRDEKRASDPDWERYAGRYRNRWGDVQMLLIVDDGL